MSLVRYYKNDQVITGMSVQSVPVAASHMSYALNEPFLYLISDSG